MTGTVSLNQLPAESTAPVGGIVHCYDPTQPAGSRDVGLAVTAFQGAFSSQPATYVLAAPSAAAGLPTFRQLIASDIPTLAPLNGTLNQFAATTSAQLASVLTDETGTGPAVFGTSPTITTPNIVGVSNGTAAAAGSIGQVISSNVLIGSAVPLVANTVANITSISLTPGMWLLWGNVVTNPASTTNQSNTLAAISTVSATIPTAPNGGAWVDVPATQPATGLFVALPVGQMVVNISATTTYYLIVQSNFATSTNSAYGFLGAVRIH